MYFVRTPCEWGMDAISATLTFLWEVVGYVEGLFFKDLKQTMKKEQCEVKLLVTASMPGKSICICLSSFKRLGAFSFTRKIRVPIPGIECIQEFLFRRVRRNIIAPSKVRACEMKRQTSEQSACESGLEE